MKWSRQNEMKFLNWQLSLCYCNSLQNEVKLNWFWSLFDSCWRPPPRLSSVWNFSQWMNFMERENKEAARRETKVKLAENMNWKALWQELNEGRQRQTLAHEFDYYAGVNTHSTRSSHFEISFLFQFFCLFYGLQCDMKYFCSLFTSNGSNVEMEKHSTEKFFPSR